MSGDDKYCCWYQHADPALPQNQQWKSCNCERIPGNSTWCKNAKAANSYSYTAELKENMCSTWDGKTHPGFDGSMPQPASASASVPVPAVAPAATASASTPAVPAAVPSKLAPAAASTTSASTTSSSASTTSSSASASASASASTSTSTSTSLPKKAVVVYVNDNFGFEQHPPTVPTPFNILVVSFLYTTSQDNAATGARSAFTFTLDAYENSGRFTSASSPLPTWIRAWQAASPTHKVFISVGGAAYGYGGFEVYPLWAKEPQRVVTALVSFLNAFAPIINFDGVDFDYEDTPSLMGTGCPTVWNYGVKLLIDLTTMLKAAKPQLLISHAPQPPYLIPNCGAKVANTMGGYVPVLAAVGDKIDYVLIQFYNNPGWMECGPGNPVDGSFTISEILNALVKQNVPKAKLIIGKPLMEKGDADNGYVAPAALPACVGDDHKSWGGIMFWALSGPDPPKRWAAMQQFVDVFYGSNTVLAQTGSKSESESETSSLSAPLLLGFLIAFIVLFVIATVLFSLQRWRPSAMPPVSV